MKTIGEYTQDELDQFRNRLNKILATKFESCTIYPLSQFEMAFGHIFGAGLPEDKLTDEQKMYRDKWRQCRTNILNFGHRQRRNCAAELQMHDVVWNRYTTIIHNKKQEG